MERPVMPHTKPRFAVAANHKSTPVEEWDARRHVRGFDFPNFFGRHDLAHLGIRSDEPPRTKS
jgi:hypothetical protein